jgi:hypothetical protein
MSLQTWVADGLLVPHKTTRVEIANFLAMAQHDLQQCRLEGLSPSWRLNIAYNGLLQVATAALAAAGYRAPSGEGHHYVVIQSLAFTVGFDEVAARKLDTLRKKRHNATYGHPGAVSDGEASDALRLITEVCAKVEAWLRKNHSDLAAK